MLNAQGRSDPPASVNSNKGRIMTQVLTLRRHEVEGVLSMTEAIAEVEEAFSIEAEVKAIMPPKVYLDLRAYHGDFRAMPAYISEVLPWIEEVKVFDKRRDGS